MKIEIEANRNNIFTGWRGRVTKKGYFNMTACNSDVDSLFEGLRTAFNCTFVVSTRRPRVEDYHTFKIENPDAIRSSYIVQEVNGQKNAIVCGTSGIIRKALRKAGATKKQTEIIHVWIY